MQHRIYGLETEYIPVFYPAQENGPVPTNREIFRTVVSVLKACFPTVLARDRGLLSKEGLFLSNSIKYNYEAKALHLDQGLIEVATPECGSPKEVLTYQRTIDDLWDEILPEVQERLQSTGYPGTLLIGKNTRDIKGNSYGCQENYLVEDNLSYIQNFLLWLVVPACWIVGLPFFLLAYLFPFGIILSILVFLLGGCVVSGILNVILERWVPGGLKVACRLRSLWSSVFKKLTSSEFEKALQKNFYIYAGGIISVWIYFYSVVLRLFLLRRFQKGLTAFLITRQIFCGSGGIRQEQGKTIFELSQKAETIRSVLHIYFDGKKPMFDIKEAFLSPLSVFKPHRRLSLMCGDSNMSEMITYLKVGVAALVLELIEEDNLSNCPVLKNPVAAFRTVSRDLTLTAKLKLKDGRRMTALEIQKKYFNMVKSYLEKREIANSEKWEILFRWGDILDRLERNPESLASELDWVIKKDLIRRIMGQDQQDSPVPESRMAQLQKIDLKYHQIGPGGYYALLEHAGQVVRVTDPDRVRLAQSVAPQTTRARVRSSYIVQGASVAGWDYVKVNGRKIPL